MEPLYSIYFKPAALAISLHAFFLIIIIMESIKRHFSTSRKAFRVVCLSRLHLNSGALQSRETNDVHTLRLRGCAGDGNALEIDGAGQGGIKNPLVLRFTRAAHLSH